MIAKPLTITYQPDERVMFKMRRQRTADCVVAGYRVHKSGNRRNRCWAYGDDGTLASVGVIGAFPMAKRREFQGNNIQQASVELGRPHVG